MTEERSTSCHLGCAWFIDEKIELGKLSCDSEWKQMILMDKNPASQLGCTKDL